MKTEYLYTTKRLTIATIITLVLILVISNVNVFLTQRALGIIILVLSVTLFIEVVILVNQLVYIYITIPKEYSDSDRYLVFNKEYNDLTNKELFNYYIALEIKSKLKVNVYYLEDYPEHIYFEYKEVGYCINTKDYGGTILDHIDGEVWDIGYGSGKYDRYGKKISVSNPFYQNKIIMDKNYNFKNKKMVSVIIISKRTKSKTTITGVYYISEFLAEFKPRK